MSGPAHRLPRHRRRAQSRRYRPAMLRRGRCHASLLLDTGGGLGVVRACWPATSIRTASATSSSSHRHLDHVGGLEPLLLTMSYRAFRSERPLSPVALYALAGSAAAIRASHAAADASAERRFGEHLRWVTPAPARRWRSTPPSGSHAGGRRSPAPGGSAAGCVVDCEARASPTAATRARATRSPRRHAAWIC